MLLQTGPRFVVPFALTTGFGLLLVLAGVALRHRSGADAGSLADHANRGLAAALALFGLGFVALAFDYAGTMAGLQTGLQRPDGTPMEPTLVGRIGLAVPWEGVALALFGLAALAALVGIGAGLRGGIGG